MTHNAPRATEMARILDETLHDPGPPHRLARWAVPDVAAPLSEHTPLANSRLRGLAATVRDRIRTRLNCGDSDVSIAARLDEYADPIADEWAHDIVAASLYETWTIWQDLALWRYAEEAYEQYGGPQRGTWQVTVWPADACMRIAAAEMITTLARIIAGDQDDPALHETRETTR